MATRADAVNEGERTLATLGPLAQMLEGLAVFAP